MLLLISWGCSSSWLFNFPFYGFMDHAFSVISKKSSSNTRSQRFSLVFLLEVLWFYVLHLNLWSTLKKFLHVVRGLDTSSFFLFFFCVCIYLTLQHHLAKRLSFFFWIVVVLCQRYVISVYVELLLNSILCYWSIYLSWCLYRAALITVAL